MGHMKSFADLLNSKWPPHDGILLFRVTSDCLDVRDGYRQGDIVFIETRLAPVVGEDVLARLPNGKDAIGRLCQDVAGYYLMISAERVERLEGCQLYGPVVQSGRVR